MFKVRAAYDYTSPHEDDLSFKAGQIITVTEEEGEDWYVGEYSDETGKRLNGLFPTNFVERYEPEPPPRPQRASRHKPSDQIQVQAAALPPMLAPLQSEPESMPVQQSELEEPLQQPSALSPAESNPPSVSSPSTTSAKVPELPRAPQQQEAAKPLLPAKKAPPPVAAKSNAFRDRIAAFNTPAAPIQPFKPAAGSTTFIKKPFVAPPPSRNAFVPPIREIPHATAYRREEDPEIAQQQIQDQEAAERIGLSGHISSPANEDEDDQPKPTSLKERIALLQKQQQEQAERAAAVHKEKLKRLPAKKTSDSHQGQIEDSEDAMLEGVTTGSSRNRVSIDHARPARTSHDFHLLSDANDADQSGAGETEDAGGESTSVDDDDERVRNRKSFVPPNDIVTTSRHPAAGTGQDIEGEEEAEEEEEGGGRRDDDDDDDQMDAEMRKRLELRERMAKMSGGMGMPGMFGGIPMSGLPPKKKKSISEKRTTEEEEEVRASHQQRASKFAMPGMSSVKAAGQEIRISTVEKQDGVTRTSMSNETANEIPHAAQITSSPTQYLHTGEQSPLTPSDRRPLHPLVSSGLPQSIPNITSPGPGSESGDEMTDDGPNSMSPTTLSATASSPLKRNSVIIPDEPQSLLERRVPSIPTASPTSLTRPRIPIPLPSAQTPPTQMSSRALDRNEGETDYEGDYDTDIAPEISHKDALRSQVRGSNMDQSFASENIHSDSSRLPPSAPKSVPPPPPGQAMRYQPSEVPRAMPLVPSIPPPTRSNARRDEGDDDDYDPYRYTSIATAPPAPLAAPPVPQNRPPPPVPQVQQQQQNIPFVTEDDLYISPPSRKSQDRPPPLPPPATPQQHAPSVPQERALPPSRPQERAIPQPPADTQPWASVGKKSLDASRAMVTRTSLDQARSAINQEFIAGDIDLGATSHWWTQPNLLPPSLQARKDVLIDTKESQSNQDVEKIISVLYLDYSQTTISARFNTSNASNIDLQQVHDPPPARLRPDQLEEAYEQFGSRIAKDVESKQNLVVGNGSPQSLIDEILKPFSSALAPVSSRAYGALVYANLANASTQSFDEIRPGDIISFRNAKFQGKTGPMHAKYSIDVGKPDHVGIVVEWDGSKKKMRVWEQGREHKKVKPESFKMSDLRSGEVRVWRVVDKSWVGWN